MRRHLIFILAIAAVLGASGCRTCENRVEWTREYSNAEPSGEVEDGVRTVYLSARRFVYAPSVIVVHQGEEVVLRALALDVFHGLDMDDYDVHLRLPPYVWQVYRFTADKPGVHEFHCSSYCGDGHKLMKGKLIVLPATQVASR